MNSDLERRQREADHRSRVPISCNKEHCQQKNEQGSTNPNNDRSGPASKQAVRKQNVGGSFDERPSEQEREGGDESPQRASLPEASSHRSVFRQAEQSLIASNAGRERDFQQPTNVMRASSRSSSSSLSSASQAHDEDPERFAAANRPIEATENMPITHPLVRMEEPIAIEKKSGQVKQALLDVTFSKPLGTGQPSTEKSPACSRPFSTTDADLDMPGEYCIVHDETFLSGTIDVLAQNDVVGFLCAGTLVRVMEVVTNESEKLVRGRVQTPEGWIPLLDTQTGYRWAFRVKPPHSVEETPSWCAATPQATQAVLPASNDTVGAVCRKPRAKAMCRRSKIYVKEEEQVSSFAAPRSSAPSSPIGLNKRREFRAKSL